MVAPCAKVVWSDLAYEEGTESALQFGSVLPTNQLAVLALPGRSPLA